MIEKKNEFQERRKSQSKLKGVKKGAMTRGKGSREGKKKRKGGNRSTCGSGDPSQIGKACRKAAGYRTKKPSNVRGEATGIGEEKRESRGLTSGKINLTEENRRISASGKS